LGMSVEKAISANEEATGTESRDYEPRSGSGLKITNAANFLHVVFAEITISSLRGQSVLRRLVGVIDL